VKSDPVLLPPARNGFIMPATYWQVDALVYDLTEEEIEIVESN
jgi:hypothetical protein